MTTPSFRDVEQLSASLDGQLSQAEKTRLEARIQKEPALGAILADLSQARAILSHTPKRRLPHNFTLTPKMAGIRPPLPRLVPAFSWASAAAMLLFILTLGANLISQISFGAAAPMIAAAPMTSEGYGFGGGPAATQAPVTDNTQITPSSQPFVMKTPEATPGETRLIPPTAIPAVKAAPEPVNLWPYIWLGLAAVLVAAALLIRMANVRAFRRKVGGKHNP